MKFVIYPYLLETYWCFDDEKTGLKQEPFVSGIPEMIERLIEVKGISNARHGFVMTFGDEPIEGHDVDLKWLRADQPRGPMSGNWYQGEVAGQLLEGWLCPALFCYFRTAPEHIFVRADPLPDGIDPVWKVSTDDPRQRRFVEPGSE